MVSIRGVTTARSSPRYDKDLCRHTASIRTSTVSTKCVFANAVMPFSLSACPSAPYASVPAAVTDTKAFQLATAAAIVTGRLGN